MVINIDKIIVKDRIRKDFGDIQELADDIKQNGLINPPVVNKDYELLAGERRLRACKSLGWSQIEIRMMDTRDAEHELNVEISENDVRKGFTKSERVDYMKRLLRIEQAKAKERQGERNDIVEIFPQSSSGKSRDATAQQFGISGKTMEKEIAIVDNKELLSQEDFADWDKGKTSTNKTFQKVEAKLKKLEDDNKDLKEKCDYLEFQLEEEQKKEPKVVEKIVEVVPDDYQELKEELEVAKRDLDVFEKDLKKANEKVKESSERVKELETAMGCKTKADATRDIQSFTTYTNDYLRRYGGHVWAFEKFNEMPESVKKDFVNAIKNLDGFAQQLITNLGGNVGAGK